MPLPRVQETILETDAGMTVSTEAVVVRCRDSLSYISMGMTIALLLTLNTLDNRLMTTLITISITTLRGDLLSLSGPGLNR